MNTALSTHIRILALDAFTRGFGFVVMEGQNLIDWGMKEARENKNARSLADLTLLIARYQPDAIVVEDPTEDRCRRCPRVRQFIRSVLKLAESREVHTYCISREAVTAVFAPSGAHTKDAIAAVIANRFPELAVRRPPLRKPWASEAERMSIFDAAAFALTFTHRSDTGLRKHQ